MGGDGVDLVLECSGTFRTVEKLEQYRKAGVKKVIAAPVTGAAPNQTARVQKTATQEAIQLARALRIARFFLLTTTAANAKGPDL